MKSHVALFLAVLFASSAVFAQDPQSKPVKPAEKEQAKKDNQKDNQKEEKKEGADKAEKKTVKKTELKDGVALSELKEFAGFVKMLDKGAQSALEGNDLESSFGKLDLRLKGDGQDAAVFKQMKDAGVATLHFFVLEYRLSVGEPGKEGTNFNMLIFIRDGKVKISAGSAFVIENDFNLKGEQEEELEEVVKPLASFARQLIKVAGECKRSKNFPFLRDTDYEWFKPLLPARVTREEWVKQFKTQMSAQSKSFIKLKKGKGKAFALSIDDAAYLAKDKDGKVLGFFNVDFNTGKKKANMSFKRYKVLGDK